MARYTVSWTPTKDVIAACQKRGMKDGDGTSFWDWIEPEYCTKTQHCPDFTKAVHFARFVLPEDCFGEAMIERLSLTRDHDDLGNTFRSKSWEVDATWHVQPDDQPVEDEPTYLAEAA